MIQVPRPPFGQPAAAKQSHLLTDVESLLSWATSLLTIAKHDTMKSALRLEIADLENWRQSLRQQNAHEGPAVWTRVDLTTAHVRSRLRMVADAFERAGPAAKFERSGPT